MIFILILTLSAPLADPAPPTHRCAVACRCPCDRGLPCTCDGERCPVDVLLTGSLPERAEIPAAALRRRAIPCTTPPPRSDPLHPHAGRGLEWRRLDCTLCHGADR